MILSCVRLRSHTWFGILRWPSASDELSILLRSGRGAKYCYEYVCLFASLSVRSHNLTNFTKFCACCLWPWFGRPLMAIKYVTYFRLWGWHHISTQCALCELLRDKSLTVETTASISTKFCSQIKISKYTSGVARRGRSLLSTTTLLEYAYKLCMMHLNIM